ncbi:hypothetical protein WN48_00759 [Eufriesea mexicana]|nr:hypothetical protein WN48_00759 [Eufriesea mexicana]
MAHFGKMDEQHPYYAIAAARMWQKPETKPVTTARFYWKFAAFNFIHKRMQETDGGFFENLGTLLAEKVRAQEQAEGPLPKKRDEAEEEEEGDDLSEEGSIEEAVEALLETDSDRDENEHTANFMIESMGWNLDIGDEKRTTCVPEYCCLFISKAVKFLYLSIPRDKSILLQPMCPSNYCISQVPKSNNQIDERVRDNYQDDRIKLVQRRVNDSLFIFGAIPSIGSLRLLTLDPGPGQNIESLG